MATEIVELGSTYTLITAETDFIAQNVNSHRQEWTRTPNPPTEEQVGVVISPENGLTSSHGTGTLYGRGKGNVVVIT